MSDGNKPNRNAKEIPRLRMKPRASDPGAIRAILESAKNFYPSEIDIAIELFEDYSQNGKDSPYQFIFAQTGDETAGFVCYGPIPLTDKRYDIYWIAVRKDLQNKHIGAALLGKAEEKIASRRGAFLYIETSSRPDYRDTHIFYERRGYSCAARLPDFYRDGDDKMIFAKKLR